MDGLPGRPVRRDGVGVSAVAPVRARHVVQLERWGWFLVFCLFVFLGSAERDFGFFGCPFRNKPKGLLSKI